MVDAKRDADALGPTKTTDAICVEAAELVAPGTLGELTEVVELESDPDPGPEPKKGACVRHL